LRPLLAASPRNFDALCVLAYIEAKLQDVEVAAELYHRALEVQESPFVRQALSQLRH
jgi:Tfp pilus assembly protein PilF